jgi:hypothetical protein
MDLCLQLIISDTEERKKAVEGVSQAAQITARKMMVQQDYFGQHLRTNDHFEEAMVKLFMNIIKFYAKAARYFARNTLARWLRNVVTADDWTGAVPPGSAVSPVGRPETPIGLSEKRIRVGAPIELTPL